VTAPQTCQPGYRLSPAEPGQGPAQHAQLAARRETTSHYSYSSRLFGPETRSVDHAPGPPSCAALGLPRRQPAEGRRVAEQVIVAFPTCPIPEVARLGRTLHAWRSQVLVHLATRGVSNGGTEAITY